MRRDDFSDKRVGFAAILLVILSTAIGAVTATVAVVSIAIKHIGG